MELPDEYLDTEGYPTDEWLSFLKTYKPSEDIPMSAFIEMLNDAWWPTSGCVAQRKYRGRIRVALHTFGWSGNEETLSVIDANIELSFFFRKRLWKAGGHHYYEAIC